MAMEPPESCSFIPMIIMLVAMHLITLRRISGLFKAMLPVVDIFIRLFYFAISKLVEIANTLNGQDVRLKMFVFFVQCVILTQVAYICALIYVPVFQFVFVLFTEIIRLVAPIVDVSL